MKIKKISLKVVAIVLTIISMFTSNLMVAEAAVNKEVDEISKDISIDELKVGEPVITYQDSDRGLKVEIELINKEERPYEINRSGYGDSGWSGGTIPTYTNMTLAVRVEDTGIAVRKLEYKVDVNGKTKTITSAYGLAYSLIAYTMESTDLNVTNPTASSSSYARAELNYTAVFVEYGIIINSYGGYLNFELDNQGHVRTSWFV